MRALDLPDGALAGIVAFYSIVHFEPADLPAVLNELRRVLVPEGVLLVAFHIGDQTLHVDDLWGRPVSLDFRFHMPGDVTRALSSAGFSVTESVEREPYEGTEHPSRRCYLLARLV
jgi:ubiquinone/menaquinone biosynthesis C-methylase UbiE